MGSTRVSRDMISILASFSFSDTLATIPGRSFPTTSTMTEARAPGKALDGRTLHTNLVLHVCVWVDGWVCLCVCGQHEAKQSYVRQTKDKDYSVMNVCSNNMQIVVKKQTASSTRKHVH